MRALLVLPWHSLLLLAGFVLIMAAGIEAPPDEVPVEAPVRAQTEPRIDASVLERFGPQETLLLTYRVRDAELLSESVLERITGLRDALAALPGVYRVTTMLDVPLLFSPQIRPVDVGGDLLHVADAGVDIDMARDELRSNPLYRGLLLARDGQETALRIVLSATAERDALLAGIEQAVAPWQGEAELFVASPQLAHGATAEQRRAALPRLALGVLALSVPLLSLLLRSLAWGVVAPLAALASALTLAGLAGWTGRGIGEASLAGVALGVLGAAAVALRLAIACRRQIAPTSDVRVMQALDGLLPVFGLVTAVAASGFLALGVLADGGLARMGGAAAVAMVLGVPIALWVAVPLSHIASDPGALAPRWRLGVGAVVLLSIVLGFGQLWIADGPLAYRHGDDGAGSDGGDRIEAALRHAVDEFGGVDSLHVVLRDDSGRSGAGSANPWFSADGMRRVREVHDYLQSLDGVRGVRSLARLQQALALLHGHEADDHELAALWNRLPRPRRERLLGASLSALAPETLLVVGFGVPDERGAPAWHVRTEAIRQHLVQNLGFNAGEIELHVVDSVPDHGPRASTSGALAIGLGAATMGALLMLLVLQRVPVRIGLRRMMVPLGIAVLGFVVLGRWLSPADPLAVLFAVLVYALACLMSSQDRTAAPGKGLS